MLAKLIVVKRSLNLCSSVVGHLLHQLMLLTSVFFGHLLRLFLSDRGELDKVATTRHFPICNKHEKKQIL